MLRGLGLATMLALTTACATPTPQATIASFEVALTSADQAALVYTSLPECSAEVQEPCANAFIKTRIKIAAQLAFESVKTAEAAVAQGGIPDTAGLAQAIGVIQSLIPQGAK